MGSSRRPLTAYLPWHLHRWPTRILNQRRLQIIITLLLYSQVLVFFDKGPSKSEDAVTSLKRLGKLVIKQQILHTTFWASASQCPRLDQRFSNFFSLCPSHQGPESTLTQQSVPASFGGGHFSVGHSGRHCTEQTKHRDLFLHHFHVAGTTLTYQSTLALMGSPFSIQSVLVPLPQQRSLLSLLMIVHPVQKSHNCSDATEPTGLVSVSVT